MPLTTRLTNHEYQQLLVMYHDQSCEFMALPSATQDLFYSRLYKK